MEFLLFFFYLHQKYTGLYVLHFVFCWTRLKTWIHFLSSWMCFVVKISCFFKHLKLRLKSSVWICPNVFDLKTELHSSFVNKIIFYLCSTLYVSGAFDHITQSPSAWITCIAMGTCASQQSNLCSWGRKWSVKVNFYVMISRRGIVEGLNICGAFPFSVVNIVLYYLGRAFEWADVTFCLLFDFKLRE